MEENFIRKTEIGVRVAYEVWNFEELERYQHF